MSMSARWEGEDLPMAPRVRAGLAVGFCAGASTTCLSLSCSGTYYTHAYSHSLGRRRYTVTPLFIYISERPRRWTRRSE